MGQEDSEASAPLQAGVAKVEITRQEAGSVGDPLYAGIDAEAANDPLYVKALVLRQGGTMAVIVTVDAVAVAEIGSIGNDYMATVRKGLQEELGIPPDSVLVNASHCHGIVCQDIEARTVEAVRQAWQAMEPVRVGVGAGHEDRIMENRRFRLKGGGEADVRRAYALPPDEEAVAVGPVDPQIGVLRVDRMDGRPLAVVFNFACHPIQGVPSGGNTADISGFAAGVIEDNLGAPALFLQGCGADVNPIRYKDTAHPRDAAPLGYMLGLSALRAVRGIQTEDGDLKVQSARLRLPRADLDEACQALEKRQQELLQSLQGTELNLKAFLPLMVRYGLSPEYPAADAHAYLHERQMGRDGLQRLDEDNRRRLAAYVHNIHIMEELSRVQVNLGLLKKHRAGNQAAAAPEVEVEVMGLRLGGFVLVTFPGELPVEIGLGIKRRSPHRFTFVAGVTNGYLYYTPTVEQLGNRGGAQEDSDCLLAPQWQGLFERQAERILAAL